MRCFIYALSYRKATLIFIEKEKTRDELHTHLSFFPHKE